MAYMSQKTKARLAPKIKKILKDNGLTGSISVYNDDSLVLVIKSGWLDFIGNHNDVTNHTIRDCMAVNQFWIDQEFNGEAHRILKELFVAMNDGNWDLSTINYHNVGWYTNITIGEFDHAYVVDQ